MNQALTPLETCLLNDYQRHFPLTPEPFACMAGELDTRTQTVIDSLKRLQQQGAVSRVGPVFRPNRIGVSTLAAICVPDDQLEQVAAMVSRYPEVNHNYEREHHFNLWFVATAPDQGHLQATLDNIAQTTGYRVISLPLVKEYHIDLGFKMGGLPGRRNPSQPPLIRGGARSEPPLAPSPDKGRDGDGFLSSSLIAAIQSGLPLVERPYFEIGQRLGLAESEVIQQIADMQAQGIIKRMGVVVRHHELGYHANAMLVWDVPDTLVDEVGQRLASADCVTLCYQRPRMLPDWPYNLFTMIHGKDRNDVLACIQDMTEQLELASLPHHVLFSRRRFKQCGARYRGH